MGLKIDEHDSKRFTLYADDEEIPLMQEYLYYKSMKGDNFRDFKRASGAYIFRPNGTSVSVCDSQKKSERFTGQKNKFKLLFPNMRNI